MSRYSYVFRYVVYVPSAVGRTRCRLKSGAVCCLFKEVARARQL